MGTFIYLVQVLIKQFQNLYKLINSFWQGLSPVRHLSAKIFGIGHPRTGTRTLGQCMRMLGFKHYSWNMRLAAEVMQHRFDNTFAVAKEYESFEDWPWFVIYKELDQRFPNSKFILTLRKDTLTYVNSLKRLHDQQGYKNRDQAKPDWWDPIFGFEPEDWDYQKSATDYERHNREVKEYFKDRPNDLLVVCWEENHGWDELCRFLGRSTPKGPFPHLNRGVTK